MDDVRHSVASAISDLFVLGTVIGILGLVAVLFLKEVPLRCTHAMEEVQEAADEGTED